MTSLAADKILRAKLETLLGERGPEKSRALRQSDMDSIISAVLNSASVKAYIETQVKKAVAAATS